MPPGVYSACPLPTPCKGTPAPSAPHPAPWHLESKPPFEEQLMACHNQPGLARSRTKATSPFCYLVSLELDAHKPSSVPTAPLSPGPHVLQCPVCSSGLSPSMQSQKQHLLSHELHSGVLPRWAQLSSASLQGRRGAEGDTACLGMKGFAAWTEIGHPGQGANAAVTRRSGFAGKGKENQSMALAWGQ